MRKAFFVLIGVVVGALIGIMVSQQRSLEGCDVLEVEATAGSGLDTVGSTLKVYNPGEVRCSHTWKKAQPVNPLEQLLQPNVAAR